MIPDFPAKQIASELIEWNGTDPSRAEIESEVKEWAAFHGPYHPLNNADMDTCVEEVCRFIDSAVVSITFPETN